MIKINDLRTGNILSYKTDEGDVYAPIDWQDLKWLTEDSVNFNLAHSAIPLTEDMLLKLGFSYRNEHRGKGAIMDGNSTAVGITESGIRHLETWVKVGYLHMLQNLYFFIKNEELNTTKLTNP